MKDTWTTLDWHWTVMGFPHEPDGWHFETVKSIYDWLKWNFFCWVYRFLVHTTKTSQAIQNSRIMQILNYHYICRMHLLNNEWLSTLHILRQCTYQTWITYYSGIIYIWRIVEWKMLFVGQINHMHAECLWRKNLKDTHVLFRIFLDTDVTVVAKLIFIAQVIISIKMCGMRLLIHSQTSLCNRWSLGMTK